MVPQYKTESRAVTVDDWMAHLRGECAVVLPLRCDDATTQVSIIDIDYDVDGNALRNKIRLLGLPLYLSRSKSGQHHHVTVFYNTPIAVTDHVRLARTPRGGSAFTANLKCCRATSPARATM